MICRICGEEKEPRQFYRYVEFPKFKKRKIWCRDCQKMWLEIHKAEEVKREFEERKSYFLVQFV